LTNFVERTRAGPDSDVALEDIKAWEKKNSKIPEGAVVIFHSGRGAHRGDDQAYFSKDEKGEDEYPGFSLEAGTFLVTQAYQCTVGTDLGHERACGKLNMTGGFGKIFGVENCPCSFRLDGSLFGREDGGLLAGFFSNKGVGIELPKTPS
jgi:hypothetical protein